MSISAATRLMAIRVEFPPEAEPVEGHLPLRKYAPAVVLDLPVVFGLPSRALRCFHPGKGLAPRVRGFVVCVSHVFGAHLCNLSSRFELDLFAWAGSILACSFQGIRPDLLGFYQRLGLKPA